jgi:poly(3-hydroxyalkanoate) synthetase
MTVSAYPPGLVLAGVDAAYGSCQALVRGSTDYFSTALSRRASTVDVGLDVLTWWRTALRRERPRWASEHTIVAQLPSAQAPQPGAPKPEAPIARLRDFSDRTWSGTHGTAAPIATLFLPPQAGHDSCIVDFAPGQSQVMTARAAGLSRVFSLDWVGATPETKHASIEDYVAVVAEAVELLGGRVNLVGDCQGGWLAAIFAALHPDAVNTLTVAGAPIDFHAGDPLIHDWMKVLSPARRLALYRTVVRANRGLLPGEFLLGGFMAMQPHGELDRLLQLLANIHDEAHVQRYRTFETWFQHTQPLPGAFYLWVIEHLFQNNELVAGELTVAGQRVELGRIDCPLYLLAGAADHITPPPQVFALAEHAGTDESRISRRTTRGGHLGLFMGHEALQRHWHELFSEIAALSRPVGS